MTGPDDTTNPFDDDALDDLPLVRALRAPGTADELARQAEFVAAFRARQSRGSFGRVAGRFGVGATAIVTSIALSGGVAAAYTRSLPDPVQQFAHDVLGPVGVPDRAPERPVARSAEPEPEPAATGTPAPAPSPSPEAPRTAAPGQPVATPAAEPAATPTATPTTTPVTPAAPSPAQTPSPTRPPARVPAALSASVPDRSVAFGTPVTVSGVLTDAEGKPLRNRTIRLAGRSAGGPWTRYAVGRTDREGRISLQSPELTRTTNLRLSTPKKLRSPVVRVVVAPSLAAVARNDGAVTTITVTAQGGRPGEVVVAYRRQGNQLVKVGSAALDERGAAVITVPTPRRTARFVLRLPATGQHGRGQTTLVVGSARTVDPEAEPTSSQ